MISLPVFTDNYSKKKIVIEVSNHINCLISTDQNLVPYFLTTVFADFECKADNQLKRKIEYSLREYDRVYRHLTSKLMNNFSKKHHLHPRTFDFVDLPGTRHTSKINAYEPSTPHIHSVYLLHKQTLNRFDDLLSTSFQAIHQHHSFGNIISIDARPIAAGTIYTVVDYSAKLLGNCAAVALSDDVPLSTQYPITKEEQRTRRDALRFESILSEQEAQNLKQKYLQRVSADHPFRHIYL